MSVRAVLQGLPSLLPSNSKRVKISVPPAPSVLLSNDRGTYYVQRPANRHQDSPLATIYRIYWAIVMNETICMRNEIEYFWSRKEESWRLCNIPHPPDHDPERFAVVSAIPFALAAAFNRLINLGLPRDEESGILTSERLEQLMQKPRALEEAPGWAKDAPPLNSPLRLPTANIGAPQTVDAVGADPFMAMKNVLVWRLHIEFT